VKEGGRGVEGSGGRGVGREVEEWGGRENIIRSYFGEILKFIR
jgi:hypothetical protein